MSINPTPSELKNPLDSSLETAAQVALSEPLSEEIKRPALRYFGGKWKLSPWIISFFPPHQNYVEPCAGACSVLLRKPRSPLETINDLDGNVVNFFRMLRDRPDELIRKIRLTPRARAEFDNAWQPVDDPLEAARRFFCLCWMSMDGAANTKSGSSWKVAINDKGYPYGLYFDDLWTIASRLIEVQMENRPAIEVITRYDHFDTLIYFDPPYVLEERSHGNNYTLEVDRAFHIEAAALLRSALGYVVVSGYACPLYAELYEAHGWRRVDKEAQTNSGGKRIESLWLSPRTVKALDSDYSHLPMFQAVQV
jgi:DNA adenine methylase